MATKRTFETSEDEDEIAQKKTKLSRKNCLFGVKCYRRNPTHFREYCHPHLECLDASGPPVNSSEVVTDQWKIVRDLNLLTGSNEPVTKHMDPQKKQHPILEKLRSAEPYNLFYTKVKAAPETHKDKQSLFLTDLLHSCHGSLKSSVQINFLVDPDWLLMCYKATGNENLPLLILHGENGDFRAAPSNVRTLQIKSPYPYGTHHTKLMILTYEDESVRIVVSTANLVPSDWENRTQGLWVSPKCPKTGTPKDSETGFKSSLVSYLNTYKVPLLKPTIDCIAAADFSSIKAFFVASSPGGYEGSSMSNFGHTQVRSLLEKHTKSVNWPLIIQCSSIGSLGATPSAWVSGELCQSLGSGMPQVVYPSTSNVLESHDGILGGGCLPYRENVHQKQPWLGDFLYQWKADKCNRTKAMPHIKTYAQIQDEKASFFLLTSANLSKAAWGKLTKSGNKLQIMSFEAGVLLLPRFITGEDHFDVSCEKLLIPYDLPLVKYASDDTPFFYDLLLESA